MLPSCLGRWIALHRAADARGVLTPLDFDALPFVPRRMFHVGQVPASTARGAHAHRSNQQLLVCLQGRIHVELRAAGACVEVACRGDGPALLVPAGVWARQTYEQPGSQLLVLCSEPYAADSYLDGPA